MENQSEIDEVIVRQNIVREEALKYRSIGFSPIPLGQIIKNTDGKKKIQYPLGWKQFEEKIASEIEISEWNYENLGIATGQVSGLLVLDTDSYKKGYDAELVKSFNLPITPMQQTASGGNQYFFKLPKGLIIRSDTSINSEDSGIDIRAEGGMVIAPPSKTSYGEYSWLVSPFEAPLADIPPKLLKLLVDGHREGERVRKALPELAGLKEGEGRNNAMTSLVGKLLLTTNPEKWDEEVLPVAMEVNNTYKPPMGEDELLGIYRSITKIESERRVKLNKNFTDENKVDPEVIIKISIRETIQKDNKQGLWEMVKFLIEKHHIKTIGNRDNTKDIYIYQNGVYKVDYGLVKKEILDITQNIVGSHFRDEVIKTIKEKTYRERKDFDVDSNLINLKNGIYSIKGKELLSHSPEYLFLHQIPVFFDKNADCPKIKQFLNQILGEELVMIIQEWLGYLLYRGYFLKKAIIFLGGKDTGKTTLFRVIEKFLGKENISGVNLQKLSSDKFALSSLFQKHANIYDDLSFKDINDNGIFKMLTGGGTVTGEKKFGDLFQFNNYAKLTFSCNKIPNIKDTDDEAYFSRWILIRFEYKPDKPDKFLFEKLSTEIEMSGLFNFALEGLFRLLETQNFSYRQTPEEIKKEMCMSSSSLAQFVYSELEVISDPDVYVTKDSMYQEFINYASNNDLPVIPKETLGKNLPKFISVGSGRKSLLNKETDKMKQIDCWIGVRLKNIKILPPSLEGQKTDIFSDLSP